MDEITITARVQTSEDRLQESLNILAWNVCKLCTETEKTRIFETVAEIYGKYDTDDLLGLIRQNMKDVKSENRASRKRSKLKIEE